MIERVGEDVGSWTQIHTPSLELTLLSLPRPQIVPLLTQISSCVPQLWENASHQEGEWLFKSSLLSLVTKMVDVSRDSLTTSLSKLR